MCCKTAESLIDGITLVKPRLIAEDTTLLDRILRKSMLLSQHRFDQRLLKT